MNLKVFLKTAPIFHQLMSLFIYFFTLCLITFKGPPKGPLEFQTDPMGTPFLKDVLELYLHLTQLNFKTVDTGQESLSVLSSSLTGQSWSCQGHHSIVCPVSVL